MNIRKNIDYSQMYSEIDKVMVQDLSLIELYSAIGKIVCAHGEKGAAVMASEYIIANYPNMHGFSPRNLRRMRDFYRTYENHPALLSVAMQIDWTQNVVIMEADLTMKLREWYMKAVRQFGWTKMELIKNIESNVHEDIVLIIGQNLCDNVAYENDGDNLGEDRNLIVNIFETYVFQLVRKRILLFRCRGKPMNGIDCVIVALCKLACVC